MSTGVGDEGGYAPSLKSDEDAIEYIIKAIEKTGYTTDEIKIALDAASSEWYSDGKYILPKRGDSLSSNELINYFDKLCSIIRLSRLKIRFPNTIGTVGRILLQKSATKFSLSAMICLLQTQKDLKRHRAWSRQRNFD